MTLTLPRYSKSFYFQITLYIIVNSLFILKYFPRTGVNSLIILLLYVALSISAIFLYGKYSNKISENTFKIGFWILLGVIILAIVGLLIAIDKYSVRVDRWSAVTFFLDNLFHGKYPYSAHTHVSNTNYASPFPFWYVINIPFYLLGDVGIGLVFFIVLTSVIVQQYFLNYRKSFFFLLMLCMAPAYWWEVAVRSDSLSNALLVFSFLVWFKTRKLSLSNNILLCVLVCGLIASTRLSAVLPLALFFFKPFVQLRWNQKITFLFGTLGVTLITFIPFIFWDTKNWIFFSRNPFMSQTGVGNSILLVIMIALGCFMALRWIDFTHFFHTASCFIFIFIFTTQVCLIYTKGIHGSIFSDNLYDISYFSLLLPYCLAYLASEIQGKIQQI